MLATTVAVSARQRLGGLLGTRSFPSATDALLIPACSSVHTFGMRYPIDVVWLSPSLTVLAIDGPVMPNRIVRGPCGAVAALELPASCTNKDALIGTMAKVKVHLGEGCE